MDGVIELSSGRPIAHVSPRPFVSISTLSPLLSESRKPSSTAPHQRRGWVRGAARGERSSQRGEEQPEGRGAARGERSSQRGKGPYEFGHKTSAPLQGELVDVGLVFFLIPGLFFGGHGFFFFFFFFFLVAVSRRGIYKVQITICIIQL